MLSRRVKTACCLVLMGLGVTSGCGDDAEPDPGEPIGGAGEGGGAQQAGSSGKSGGGGTTAGATSTAGSEAGGHGPSEGGGQAGGIDGGGNGPDPIGGGGQAGALVGGQGGDSAAVGEGGGESGGSGGEGGAQNDLVQWLGACFPVGFSNDGKTVLAKEGLWTASDGWQALPDLAGGETVNHPRALSPDGKVVFGNSGSALGLEAYRWVVGQAIEGWGELYLPLAASYDGKIVVGSTSFDDDPMFNPFRWVQGSGFTLPDDWSYPAHADENYDDEVTAVLSDAGDLAFFNYYKEEAVRWTTANGFEERPFIYGAVSGNGSKVGSFSTYDPFGSPSVCLNDSPDECVSGVACGCSVVAFFDYDQTGASGVGIEYHDISGVPQPEAFAAFHWSASGGVRKLADVLPLPSGTVVYPKAGTAAEWRGFRRHPFISADGTLVLAQTQAGECFIAPVTP